MNLAEPRQASTVTETGPFWLSRRTLLHRAGIAGASGLLGSALLAITPAPALASDPFKPSVDQQKRMGRQAAQQILHKYREAHDHRADFFEEIGRKLVAALPDDDRNRWDFRFHVLESKEVNAFALPGGPMFMFTGLYDKLDTVDALAAVTGHEMTHVRKEHWANAYATNEKRRLGLSILLGVTHAPDWEQLGAGLFDNMISLKYSRGEEDAADAGGLEDMVAAGYNPDGMLNLFKTLQRIAGNGGGVGGDLLSDHPLTSERIENTKRRIAALHPDPPFPPLTPLDYKSLLPPPPPFPPPYPPSG